MRCLSVMGLPVICRVGPHFGVGFRQGACVLSGRAE